MHLIPAYGRDYTSRDAILADLKAGKDFLLCGGHRPVPINLEQIEPQHYPLQVRYRDLRSLAIIHQRELA